MLTDRILTYGMAAGKVVYGDILEVVARFSGLLKGFGVKEVGNWRS